MTIQIKVVPDDNPDADGETIDVPDDAVTEQIRWANINEMLERYIPKDHHIVKITRRTV